MQDMLKNKFDYFRGEEAEQYSFYRIPKILFTSKKFSGLSIEAKVLYGLLLDRMSLSVKNGWIDEDNHVYIYFKLEDAMDFMGIGKDKGVRLFAELDTEKGCGLIQRKKQGLGKPTLIYVMNFNTRDDKETCESCKAEENKNAEKPCVFQTSGKQNSGLSDGVEVLTSEKQNSGLLKNRPQDFGKTEHQTSEKSKSELLKNRTLDFGKTDSNNTEFNYNKINNTEMSDIESITSYPSKGVEISSADDRVTDEIEMRRQYRNLIYQNIGYNKLICNYDEELIEGIGGIMLDIICSKRPYIDINQEGMPTEVVKSRFLKLTDEHIEYVIDCLKKNTTKIKNIKSYLITALYNSYATISPYYRAEVNHDLYGQGGK